MKKPEGLKEDNLIFLDNLRESGVTNMWGARPYLMEYDEELTKAEAGATMSYWMETFSERHPSS